MKDSSTNHKITFVRVQLNYSPDLKALTFDLLPFHCLPIGDSHKCFLLRLHIDLNKRVHFEAKCKGCHHFWLILALLPEKGDFFSALQGEADLQEASVAHLSPEKISELLTFQSLNASTCPSCFFLYFLLILCSARC